MAKKNKKQKKNKPAAAPLQVEVEDLGNCERRLRVEVPVERIDREIEKGYRDLARSVPIPGFRPGKVPKAILEKKFGDALVHQVRHQLIEDTLREALSERGLDVIGEPELDHDHDACGPGQPLTYAVTLKIRPQFELPPLEEITVPGEEPKVTEEHVDRDLENLRRTRAEYQPLEKGNVEKTDIVVGDVVFMLDELDDDEDEGAEGEGEKKEPAHPKDEPLYREEDVEIDIEEGSFTIRGPDNETCEIAAEEISDDLLGLEPGQTGEVEITLPTGFPVDAGRGRDAIAHVTVRDIKRLVIPEMTEEWAKELGYDSVEDLRNDIRSGLQQRFEREHARIIENMCVESIVHAAGEFELPSELVDDQAKALMAAQRERLEAEGQQGEELEKALGELEAEAYGVAAHRLREVFVLQKVAATERVFLTESEVDAEIQRMASMRGASAAQLRKALEAQEGGLQILQSELRQRKTRALLASRARILTPAEFEAEMKAKLEEARAKAEASEGETEGGATEGDEDEAAAAATTGETKQDEQTSS